MSSIRPLIPLVQSFDELSDKEVEEKILSLNKKYWQTQNPASARANYSPDMYKVEMEGRRAQSK